MADYDSSLPIRTETDGDAVVKIGDGTTPAQYWAIDANGIGSVNLNDGTNTLVINANGSLTAQITDGTNALVIGANGEVTAIVTDGTNTIAIDASGNVSSLITDGTDQLEVNADGSINVIVQNSVSGGEVHAYGTVAALVPATPTTVATFTTTALKTFRLMAVQAAASGKFKAEVKVNAVTVAVFFGSTAEGSVELTFPQPIEVAAGLVTIVEMTNRDKQNADAYAFINGVEV